MNKLYLKQWFVVLAVLLGHALPGLAGTATLSLAPVPYELTLPAEIAGRLSTVPLAGPFAEETERAGAVASTGVLYEPQSGNKTILMGVYYFPEKNFDAAQNPDEPPPFGKAVIREGGMVLSIAGPHDSIFDAGTADADNINAASKLIYEPGTYARSD